VCTDRLMKRRSKPRHGFVTTHAGLYPQNEPHVKKRGRLEGFWKPSQPAAPDTYLLLDTYV
jgi:hypothetical protein